MLLAGVGVALLLMLLLDYVRQRLQNVLGNIIDERLSPPVVQAIVARAARSPHGSRATACATSPRCAACSRPTA